MTPALHLISVNSTTRNRDLRFVLQTVCEHHNNVMNIKKWLKRTRQKNGIGLCVEAGPDQRVGLLDVIHSTPADGLADFALLTVGLRTASSEGQHLWTDVAWDLSAWVLACLNEFGEAEGIGPPPMKIPTPATGQTPVVRSSSGAPPGQAVEALAAEAWPADRFTVIRGLPNGSLSDQAHSLPAYEDELSQLLGEAAVADAEVDLTTDAIRWVLPPLGPQ